MRRAANVDANQFEIVQKLRKCGVSVVSLAVVGNGVPDLVCGFRGRTILLEIKDAKTPIKKSQIEWHAKWNGQAAIVRSFDEAMDTILEAVK